jgi:hypothetical protein
MDVDRVGGGIASFVLRRKVALEGKPGWMGWGVFKGDTNQLLGIGGRLG